MPPVSVVRPLCGAIALACLLAVSSPGRAAPVEALHDATVVSDDTLVVRTRAAVAVAVEAARGLRRSEPIAGATVEVALERVAAIRTRAPGVLARGATAADGTAALEFDVPAVPAGAYALVVTTRSRFGEAVTRREVEVVERVHLHLRADRPVYRAGQVLRWRASLVGGIDAHPLVGQPVELRVDDPRGTAIWRGTSTTGPGGMVAGEVPLGDDLILGGYALRAEALGASAREAVDVKAFRPPAFLVNLAVDRPARDGAVAGRVTARLAYGAPVRGAVEVSDEHGRVAGGALDAGGGFGFALPAGERTALTAIVTDGAGRAERARAELPARRDDLAIAIVPEHPTLAGGRREAFTVIATDGAGALVPARISLRVGSGVRHVRDADGAARFELAIPDDVGSLNVQAAAATADGRAAVASRRIAVGKAIPMIRPVVAIVEAGDEVRATGTWPAAHGPLVATLLRDRTPIASTIVRRDGATVTVALRPPPGAFGLATLRVTDLGWDPKTRAPGAAADATVYLRPATLSVAIATQARRRPGEAAPIAIAVRDAAGRPVAGAAIAASVVDERILALGEARPDLVEALAALDVAEAKLAGLAFVATLAGPRSAATDLVLRAILEALPRAAPTPELQRPALDRLVAELDRLRLAREVAIARLVVAGGPIGTWEAGWRYRAPLDGLLAAAAWTPARIATPWRAPTTWAYALDADPSFGFAVVAGEVTDARLGALADWLRPRRAARRPLLRGGALASVGVPERLRVDAWGGPVRVLAQDQDGGPAMLALVSAGPDRRLSTADDVRVDDVFRDSTTGFGMLGSGEGGGGGVGFGSIGAGAYGSIGRGAGEAPIAAVRRRFDETVLWVAGALTDERGALELTPTLADSLTGWRVAVEAISAAGAVGAATARIETSLPLQLDAELPAAGLTTGDRYAVPIVIGNHGERDLVLAVRAEARGALALDGPPPAPIRVPRGEVRAVEVGVRARQAGDGTLALALLDGAAIVDRVERTLAVLPPGELVRDLATVELGQGGGALELAIAEDAALGSARATVRVFRGVADQALDGLEGMLREPTGCFEQTSSAMYPDLLVLRLLDGAAGHDAARGQARAMIARGYQRLISYEVEGGGFSWFGESPANQVLTAYGLLEFADLAPVYPVDPDLIARTRRWLLGKQQADGSWRPDASWLHDWSQVQGKVSTTAYVAWALAESGYRGPALDRALGFLRARAAGLADPYVRAIWAAAEAIGGRRGDAALAPLLARGVRDADGLRLGGGGRTLFYGEGDDADVQITALAATALHRRGRADDARAALRWLWSRRDPSFGWGSTQSTVLALRAAAVTAGAARAPTGTLAVALDGAPLGTLDLARPELPTLALPDRLGPGRHRVALRGDAAGLRAELRVAWRPRRPTAERAGLDVAIRPPSGPTAIGARGRFVVTVANLGAKVVAMPTVVIPLPPGFLGGDDAVRRLRGAAGVARVEDLGSELRVYLHRLDAGARATLAYDLEPTAVATVTQRAVQAYAYYAPSVRGRSAPVEVVAVAADTPTPTVAPGRAAPRPAPAAAPQP